MRAQGPRTLLSEQASVPSRGIHGHPQLCSCSPLFSLSKYAYLGISQAPWGPFISFTTKLLLYLEWDPPTTLTLLGLAHFHSSSDFHSLIQQACPGSLCHTHPFIRSITFGLVLGCQIFSLGEGRTLPSLLRDLSPGPHT